jgi:hypothetical protein
VDSAGPKKIYNFGGESATWTTAREIVIICGAKGTKHFEKKISRRQLYFRECYDKV